MNKAPRTSRPRRQQSASTLPSQTLPSETQRSETRHTEAADEVNSFAARLLAWWDRDGRKDLPWQSNRSAYRVWISEIMLQQTQVSTVIGYFNRFIARFPNVQSLAAASQDDVLHHWAGLGYYARGRNLHRAAQTICAQFNGELPPTTAELALLPGIGQSTANAIDALARDGRSAILDGNVKRVLARWRGITGWPGNHDVEAELWRISADVLPAERMADYTQAIMDLGATLCRRSKPDCSNCPLNHDCVATLTAQTATLPTARPKRALPDRDVSMWVVMCDGATLLQLRPSTGIWGGLWGFPETATVDAETIHATQIALLEQLGLHATVDVPPTQLPAFTHVFTHFRLRIAPLLVHLSGSLDEQHPKLGEPNQFMWYRDGEQHIGLSAVVARVLRELQDAGAVPSAHDSPHESAE